MKKYCVQFFLLLACLCSYPVHAEQEPEPLQTLKPKKKLAICYFGLTRSTKKVYPTHFQYLFNVLDAHQIDYDVFLHTWHLKGKQRIWADEIDTPIDYEEHKFLKPRFYRIDSQDDFTESLDFTQYFNRELWLDRHNNPNPDIEWDPFLILNHLCALESQKRVTAMIETSDYSYDVVMYIRPDSLLQEPIDPNLILNLKPGEVAIPDRDHYCGGYNDKLAILCYETAPLYGKRIDQIVEYRRTQGRIHSESYTKYACDANHLKVILFPYNFELERP